MYFRCQCVFEEEHQAVFWFFMVVLRTLVIFCLGCRSVAAVWSAFYTLSLRKRFGGPAFWKHHWRRTWLGVLCGTGGDAKSWIHHRLLPAERHDPAVRHPDGQVRPTSNSAGWQVGSQNTLCPSVCEAGVKTPQTTQPWSSSLSEKESN